jgi:hypothetical protein
MKKLLLIILCFFLVSCWKDEKIEIQENSNTWVIQEEKTLSKENIKAWLIDKSTLNLEELKIYNTLMDEIKEEIELETIAPLQKWQYDTLEDEMDWSIAYFAWIVSTNKAELSSPYDGANYYKLVVKNIEWKNYVNFLVLKGQILSWDYYSRTIRIKFDDEEPFEVNYSLSNYSNSEVFLENEKKIIEKIKTAKTMMIEADYYKDWLKVAKFNIEWLEWNY